MKIDLETIANLAGRLAVLLAAAKNMGINVGPPLVEKILSFISQLAAISSQAGESGKRVSEEFDRLVKQIEDVESRIKAGSGPDAVRNAFTILEARAETAVVRIQQELDRRT